MVYNIIDVSKSIDCIAKARLNFSTRIVYLYSLFVYILFLFITFDVSELLFVFCFRANRNGSNMKHTFEVSKYALVKFLAESKCSELDTMCANLFVTLNCFSIIIVRMSMSSHKTPKM